MEKEIAIIQQQKLDYLKNQNIQYTNEQLQFIHAPKNRDIKITACAGSGKTQCVLEFTKQALKEGFHPKDVCITTFNIQASNDMKKRAIELMGKDQADLIEILNFDKIITKFFQIIQKSKNQINQKKQNQIVNKSQQAIELTLCEKQFQLYQDLQDQSLSKTIFESYKLIIFDEFQDINQLQYEILILFKKIGKSVIVVVGDDLQNIYEFRGSDYKFLRSQVIEDINNENRKIYGNESFNMLEFSLTTNFRCSSKITAFANDIIRSFQYINQNTMQSFEDLESYQSKKCEIKPTLEPQKSYNDMFKEIYNFITSKVQNEGYSYSDIAIISPTGFPLRQIELKLEQHNFNQPEKEIPFWSFVGKNKDFDFSFEYKGNKVTLLTAHKSKGLQWKALFFIGINDDQFPEAFIRQVANYDKKIEEMRRLFYVGSTRAAQILKLSYFSNNNRKACRFLSVIDKNNIQFKGQPQIAYEQNTTNSNQKQHFDKYLRDIFEEICNLQHIVQLQNTEKFLKEEYFYQEKIKQLHKPMFSRNQIQKIFFNQSEEILFSYLETIILRILIEKTQIIYKPEIIDEQLQQITRNKNSLQVNENFISSYQQSKDQFLNKDLSINKNIELTLSIYKTSILFEISKSKVYKYLFQKNPFYSMTKNIVQCLNCFVEQLTDEEKNELLVIDRICYSNDPINIYENFIISSKETIYEVTQSFKKTKIVEKQAMLIVLGKISILKMQYGRDIKKISFYNPIKGTVFSVLLKNWTFHKQFINFMENFIDKPIDSSDSSQNFSQNCLNQTQYHKATACFQQENEIIKEEKQVHDKNKIFQQTFQTQQQKQMNSQISFCKASNLLSINKKKELIHSPKQLQQQKEVIKKLKK
ncbi:hypothetical protein ABPG72_015892 [Tetrahymena utriculariae]